MDKPLFMCKGNEVLCEIFRHNDEPVIKEFHINGVKQNRVLNAFKFGLRSAFPFLLRRKIL